MNDLDLLWAFGKRTTWERYSGVVKEHNLTKEALQVFKDISAWYEEDTTRTTIDWTAFATWFKHVKHSTYKPEVMDLYTKIFDNLTKITASPIEADLIKSFITKDYLTRIADLSLRGAEGTKVVTIDDISTVIEEHNTAVGVTTEESFIVEEDIHGLLSHVVSGGGYNWRLNELNKSLGPLRKGDFIVMTARPDAGKCLAKGTPILMYDGTIKPVEDVKEGELVMGPDSLPRTVFGATSGREKMYRIQYKNGTYYEVNESHVLSLKRSKAEGKYCKHKTGDILNVSVKDYINWPIGRKQRYKGWKTGVEFSFNPDPLWIDPYILGVWLGDGHSDGPTFTNMDEEIWTQILSQAKKVSLDTGDNYYVQYQATNNTGKAITGRITHGKKGKKNFFTHKLDELSLIKNKHIPDIYKCNHSSIRKQVLAGLLDTDGSVSQNCGYEITQKNKKLALDILYISQSLGYSATLNTKVIDGTEYYRVHIHGDFSDLPVRIPHKRLGTSTNPKRKGLHYGFDVFPLEVGEYYGFAVDKDHLFMLGDFTVTHNTTMLASEATCMAVQLAQGKHVLWFNNEEEGMKVKFRVIQAAIGWTTDQIETNPNKAYELYEKEVGSLDKILIYDRASFTVRDVKRTLDRYDAGLIIFDQLRKVHGFEKEGGNEVGRLQLVFQQAREWAKEYAPVITVHQADGTAEGQKWIELNQLHMSKTDIVGEADAVVSLGRTHEPGFEHTRFLYIPKNKLAGGPMSDGSFRNGKFELEILPEIARFRGVL